MTKSQKKTNVGVLVKLDISGVKKTFLKIPAANNLQLVPAHG
jgi:hypothetical protein